MIQYRRGYRLFCTRGIHFQPFVQLIKIATSNISRRQDLNIRRELNDSINNTDDSFFHPA